MCPLTAGWDTPRAWWGAQVRAGCGHLELCWVWEVMLLALKVRRGRWYLGWPVPRTSRLAFVALNQIWKETLPRPLCGPGLGAVRRLAGGHLAREVPQDGSQHSDSPVPPGPRTLTGLFVLRQVSPQCSSGFLARSPCPPHPSRRGCLSRALDTASGLSPPVSTCSCQQTDGGPHRGLTSIF